jgi:curved DNA-binding protein CbpA
MNYKKACNVLNIKEKSNYDYGEIKKQYKIMALMYHPDKNPSEDASAKFQEVHSAYEYLMDYNNEDTYDSDEDKKSVDKGSYKWVLFSFIKNVLKTETGNYLFYTILERISNMCEKNALETLEKLENSLLIKIYELIKKYEYAFHFKEGFIEKIEDIIKSKVQRDECIILNPTLDDLFENNLYGLTVNNRKYIVPLWHHELVYDNSGCNLYIKCNPILPENIEIDDVNNIRVKVKYNIDDLWEKDEINVYIGRHTVAVCPKLLKMKQTQTIVLKEQGISKINTNNVYDVTKRSDVYLHFTITK